MPDAMKPEIHSNPQAAFPSALRGLATAVAFALAIVASAPHGASAQGAVILVNGDPITNFDIEQRSKLLQVSTQKTPARQDVVEELITEKIKIQLLKRYTIPDVDKDVDNAYANMARRMRQSPKEFSEQLSRTGVMPETLKSRMKADIVWTQIVRGRYQASFQFSDRDIQSKIQFQNCEEGIQLARNVRFVAVRPPVTKNSAELPAALRDILTKTEIGRLTPPESTQQGVEVYAVCGRKQSDNAVEKKEARDQLYSETFDQRSKAFLKELRSQAMIEYKQ
jgi:peptidyl-prolyl cis-trans isomerase SurA